MSYVVTRECMSVGCNECMQRCETFSRNVLDQAKRRSLNLQHAPASNMYRARSDESIRPIWRHSHTAFHLQLNLPSKRQEAYALYILLSNTARY